jgi:hypothetical protein
MTTNNNDSSITISAGGTTFAGPDAVMLFRTAALASALGLYAKCGMIPTRGVTITRMLQSASAVTGKKYKRGEALKAQADLKTWCDAMKAAIPVEVQ